MGGTASGKQNAAQEPYIADDYVWAAICYLDSPGDSRLQGGHQPERRPSDEPLIFLDDVSRDTPGNSFTRFLIGLIFLLIVMILKLRG